MGGELDTLPEDSFFVEETHFQHPDIKRIFADCSELPMEEQRVTHKIDKLKNKLKSRLNQFIKHFGIDLLVGENVLTIPLNIPLGFALTEIILEKEIPTIAHHYDYPWEFPPFSSRSDIKDLHDFNAKKQLYNTLQSKQSQINVFISYAKEDEKIANRLYKDLKNIKKYNIEPWIDTENILPGQKWKTSISKAIKDSSCFIALFSSNSISKKGYVQKELKLAMDLLDEYPISEIFLIPIRLNRCEPIDDKLQDIQWVDFFPSYEKGFKKLLKAFEVKKRFLREPSESLTYLKRESFSYKDDIKRALYMAFPPNLPCIKHVVLNSDAHRQLGFEKGIEPKIIPYVMDFENPPSPPDDYASDVRQALNVSDDEFLILQPTRVIKSKGIEYSIELVHRLGMKAKLIITHASGDEGYDYERRVREYSKMMKVETYFAANIIGRTRGKTKNGRKIYTLEDVYTHADLVTFPSLFESFGAAFIESIYFCKPIVINTYSTYTRDIKPHLFSLIEFDGYVTDEAVRKTRKVLTDAELRKKMVQYNYETAKKYFSFSLLQRELYGILANLPDQYSRP
jgi:glycosyltransferase involved in cell wall biosynthesis